jgi:hypothetical protein
MSTPIPEPDDPTPIDPIQDPPIDLPKNNPLERDSDKEGPWRPGDSTESGDEG